MLTENEIRNQIAIAETKAKQMEYEGWDGEPEYFGYHYGYIHALNYVLGLTKAQYNKEDI